MERRPMETLPTLLGSATAGLVGRLFCHPLDTIKARRQANISSAKIMHQHRGFVAWTRGVLRSVSLAQVQSLYRGIGVSMIGSAPATCLYLTSYETAKDSLASSDLMASRPALLYLASGMIAEAVSCVLWVPIDVIKERMQVRYTPPTGGGVGSGGVGMYYRNTWHAVASITNQERLTGLYRGYGATLLSFGPFSALYFMIYETNKQFWQDRWNTQQLSAQATLASAAAAGALASFLTNPFDLVKLRLQVQRGTTAMANGAVGTTCSSTWHYAGVRDGFVQIVRTEGLYALFKGAGARVAFHAPSTAITMALFERCKGFYVDLLDQTRSQQPFSQ